MESRQITDALVLNLDYLPERLDKTLQQAARSRIIGPIARQFVAVNGFELQNAPEAEQYLKEHPDADAPERYAQYQRVMEPLQQGGLIDPEYKGVIKAGTIGNYLSWYRILQHIVEDAPGGQGWKKEDDLILVLEDDVTIPDGRAFDRNLESILQNMPEDADVVYLGCSDFSKLVCTDHSDLLYRIHPDSTVVAGLYAVLLTRRAARWMLRRWLPMQKYSDMQFGHWFSEGKLTGYISKAELIHVDYTMSYTNSAVSNGWVANYYGRLHKEFELRKA